MLALTFFCLSFLIPKLKLGGENVAVTEPAFARSIRPPPVFNTPTVVVLTLVVKTSVVAELIKADLICSGVNEGFNCLTSAAAPATCGVAWLVPLIARKPLGSTTGFLVEGLLLTAPE